MIPKCDRCGSEHLFGNSDRGRVALLKHYLAQVAEHLSDAQRGERFLRVIDDALGDLDLPDSDRERRAEAILAAASELVAFSVDVTLELAAVAYQRINRDGP